MKANKQSQASESEDSSRIKIAKSEIEVAEKESEVTKIGLSQVDAEFNANLDSKKWFIGSEFGGRTCQSSLYSAAFSDSSLKSKNGWKSAKNSSQEYVGTTFEKPVTLQGIRVASAAAGEYISEFTIQYSLDKKNFIDIG